MISEHKNALALLARATQLLTNALPTLVSLPNSQDSSPPSIAISASDARNLESLLRGELQRHRALVELSNLTTASPSPSAASTPAAPLIDRLSTFPPNGSVDLTNLVTYPPKIEPIPVKPLFFDVAWNYIEYPSQKEENTASAGSTESDEKPKKIQEKAGKGWFGFGR